jgi:hypothetical protein
MGVVLLRFWLDEFSLTPCLLDALDDPPPILLPVFATLLVEVFLSSALVVF